MTYEQATEIFQRMKPEDQAEVRLLCPEAGMVEQDKAERIIISAIQRIQRAKPLGRPI